MLLWGDLHHPGAMTMRNGRFAVCAPTNQQVAQVWWEDLKALCHPSWVRRIRESEPKCIEFETGSTITLIGLDKPQRAEGVAFDGVVVDETQEIKPVAWTRSLYPTLTNLGREPGWSLRIGRPAGRNHFFEWWTEAKTREDHDSFHWASSAVLPPDMIAAAKRDLDPRSFQQEYEASFLSLVGLVFYQWDPNKHLRAVNYDPALPLVFAFDFNVAPGSAVVLQEQLLPPWDLPRGMLHSTTCVVDEVFIPSDSRTPEVCQQLAARYREHHGDVFVYGDPAGNQNRTSASTNDWDIVRQELGRAFGQRVRMRVPLAHPPVIDSVNSTNTRLQSADGTVRFALNPQKAPQTRKDFEGVQWDEEKTERQIDKSDLDRGHWCDAVRYYIHERHPLGGPKVGSY